MSISASATIGANCLQCSQTSAGPPAYYKCTACLTFNTNGWTGTYLDTDTCSTTCNLVGCDKCSAKTTCAKCLAGYTLTSGTCNKITE